MQAGKINQSPVGESVSNRRCLTPKNGKTKRRSAFDGFENSPQAKKICSPESRSDKDEIRTGTIIGNYRVCQSLAHGSHSRIYLATRGDKNYAIKVQKHETEQQKKDNVRESEVLNKISESNATDFLVQCYDTIEHGSNYCFVLEKLDFSLHEFFFMNRHKPLELEKVTHLTTQLTKATAKLAEIGFLHFDIKPANILLCNRSDASDQWRIKLCDFGFSVSSTEISNYCGPIQTVNYRAPEAILGLPLCERVETWSIGCVLFKLYTGLELFTARDEIEMLRYRQTLMVTGPPEDLAKGRKTSEFFDEKLVLKNSSSTKMYPMKYAKKGFKGIEELGHNYLTSGSFTKMDLAIVRLITSCLQPSAHKRRTAAEMIDYMKFSIESIRDDCQDE